MTNVQKLDIKRSELRSKLIADDAMMSPRRSRIGNQGTPRHRESISDRRCD